MNRSRWLYTFRFLLALLAIAVDVVDVISSLTFDDISSYHLTTLELKRLTEFLDEVDVRATFFVVPNKLKDKEFVDELKRTAAKGHELALHGVNHVKNEFGVFYPVPLPLPIPTHKKQKMLLEKGVETMIKLTETRPVGFRAPYLLHSSATLQELSNLGFRYDSSLSIFKPAHASHFRIRWSPKVNPFFSNGILEICITGDYTFKLNSNNFHYFFNMAIWDYKWITSHKGVFVLNNHPKRLDKNGYYFLKTLIEEISENSNFYKLCDVAKYVYSQN